jgi:acetyltransferase-like isoleucine patch superfamily enzyme
MFETKPRKVLTYFEVRGFLRNVKVSSRNRGMSIPGFLFMKMKNYILEILAYACPVNSLRVLFHKWRGVKIGKNVFIGMRCVLDHAYPDYIILEDNSALAGNVYIVAHSKPPIQFRKKLPSYVDTVRIKKDAWIGLNVTVLPGVIVGEGSIVTSGSVVSQKIPKGVMVRGNPAALVTKLDDLPDLKLKEDK